jgi:hypothetical protein
MSCWLRLSVSSDRRDRTFRNLPGAPKRQLASVPFKNGAVVEQSHGRRSKCRSLSRNAIPPPRRYRKHKAER